jgi:dolichol kinase
MLEIAFFAVAALSAILMGVRIKRKSLYATAMLSGMLTSAAAALLIGQGASLAILAAGTAVLACLIATCYISRPMLFTALLIFLALSIIASIYYYGDTALVGMFGIGSVCGLEYRDLGRKNHVARGTRKVETNRDVVQILLGIVVFALLALLSQPYSIYGVFALIIIGYAVTSLYAGRRGREGAYGRMVSTLERSNVTHGIGAVYLAVGTMLVMGFAGSRGLVLFGIAALFFADSIATIIGMHIGRVRMPHNKGKTLEGSIAFFLVLALLGFALIGMYAVPLAAALAIIESLKVRLDDNLRSGIVMALIGIALRL